jgi:HlyD family secretion protein
MKKTRLIWMSGLLVVLVICGWVLWGRGSQSPVTIETVAATRGSIKNSITATGTVKPVTQVEVGTQTSGAIKKIYADYNSVVKKGQLLAELDKTTLETAVAQARAAVNAATNDSVYQAGIFHRQQDLHDKKMVSDAAYEQAVFSFNQAAISLARARLDLDRANTSLGYAYIYSPVDGTVLSRAVDAGQTVAASLSAPTLFVIAASLDRMQVEAAVDEADIGQVKPA